MSLTITQLRGIFVGVYLLVDILYVYLSSTVYQSAARSISGKSFPSGTGRMAAAVIAWGCMALGWYFLAAPAAEATKSLGKAVLIGFIYGLAIIGTFNFTLTAMFEGWSGSILVRDLVWGISWATLSIGLYYYFGIRARNNIKS